MFTQHFRAFSAAGNMSRIWKFVRITVVSALSMLSASTVMAQPSAVGLQRASRETIANAAAELESQITGGKLKGDRKDAAVEQLESIRTRLASGDFRAGDRFVYTLTMDSVRADTATVRDGMMVSISNLPDVSVKGVLRSELDDVLNTHIGKYLRNARIRTITMVQVSVLGGVARPGFYWASPDRPISELIMLAGGPMPEANLRELEIKRSNKVILKPKDSRKALEESQTIEQVDVRSGDEIRIPMKRKVNWQQVIQLLFVASSLFFAALQFITWYYNRQE